ncbi:AGXT2 [Cordylochernes scorpioides]|uniref:AGXT2 n=1 Tax=Cordylochernes scorpioides TaxID=51811 RepID=A0ABY6JWA6_9ARAC|nr:AGXT2 [Cordylochernes scorpioides]
MVVQAMIIMESRTPLPTPEVGEIFEDCKDMGLLVGKGGNFGNNDSMDVWQVLRIKPPMCVTKEDADFCISVLSIALDKFIKRKS